MNRSRLEQPTGVSIYVFMCIVQTCVRDVASADDVGDEGVVSGPAIIPFYLAAGYLGVAK